jgi:hypothetical protein
LVDSKQQSSNVAYLQVPATTLPGLTTDRAHGYYSSPWKLLAVNDETATIEIAYAAGIPGCAYAVGTYVNETTNIVLVAVLTTLRTVGSCNSALDVGRTILHLHGPLAG